MDAETFPLGGMWTEDAAWIEQDIPPRPWIAPRYLLRGSVTVVGGPGSAGKSSLMVAWSVGLALGLPYGRFAPVASQKVLLFNVEDDGNEQRRRFSATLRQFNRTPDSLAGKICRAGPKQVGQLVTRDVYGTITPTPLGFELLEHIKATQPDVVIVDPLAELHGCDENDNTGLRAVVAWLREQAQPKDGSKGLAMVVLHHTRKGSQGAAGDPDTLRGASSIIGAARVVLTVSGMTEDEAKALNVPHDHRRHFFRLDGAKANYSPTTEAEWFERQQYELDNGDLVAAPVPWTPPEDVISLETLLAIEAGIAAGCAGEPWAKQGGSDRDIKNLLAQHGVATAAGQTKAKQHLLGVGVTIAAYRNENRIKAQGYRTKNGEPSAVNWVEAKP